MYRLIQSLLLIVAVYFVNAVAQDEFDQLPPDSSQSGISTITTEEDHISRKKSTNDRYQKDYKEFISGKKSIIRDLEKQARNVKIIYIIAWLLPAIGALINFINK